LSLDRFLKSIEQHNPSARLTHSEAVEAFQNLSGFMSLLVKINEREQVVPTKPARKGRHHADQ